MKTISKIMLGLIVAAGIPALVKASGHDHAGPAAATKAAATQTAQPLSDGEIKKVDKSTKKITIKHGDIKSLDMPGMTMVFGIKDAAMLDNLKTGDKVKFKAEQAGSAIVVTEIQPAK